MYLSEVIARAYPHTLLEPRKSLEEIFGVEDASGIGLEESE